MQYIVHTRFKGLALCGNVNLPVHTICQERSGTILWNGKTVCYAGSENAHQHFARDDDGCGLERGKLTQAIQKRLAKTDKRHQDRWDKIWEDPICQKFKRPEHEDHWLWNHDFFNAAIEDLRYIANLIDVKGDF